MSVKYSWSRQNGAAVPPVRFMSIEPAEDYYKGMPLKLKEKGIVEPTDGDPEYICMAQYDPGAEIQPLEIPVQEVFPDVVYDRMNDDGEIEEVRFGSKGGGADVLNENGKLKSEVLPEGYPYMGVEERTVEYIPTEENEGFTILEGFPLFAVGDTVKVKIDGVEYSLVANEIYDEPAIGDPPDQIEQGDGEYGWVIACVTDMDVIFQASESHTVSWEVPVIVPMDAKFLPPGIGGVEVVLISKGGNKYETGESFTYEEAKELHDKWVEGKARVLVCSGVGLSGGSSEEKTEILAFQKSAADSSGSTYNLNIHFYNMSAGKVEFMTIATPNS